MAKSARDRTDGGVRGRLARGVPGAEEDGALRERLRAATALASVAHRGKVWETDRARCAHWNVDEGGVFIRQRRLRGVVPVGSAVYGGDFVSTQGAESMEGARGGESTGRRRAHARRARLGDRARVFGRRVFVLSWDFRSRAREARHRRGGALADAGATSILPRWVRAASRELARRFLGLDFREHDV